MIRKKRFAALALAGLMGMMTLTPSLETLAKAWSRVDGAYQMLDGSVIDGVFARGIDISHWQQDIDWAAVAADDVEFVMLGTRYKGEVDPRFHYNASEAHKNGVKLGAYIYSYATTPEMALAEAEYILNLIKDYPISYPVVFDVEDNVQSSLTPAQVSELINTFCKRIEEAGYYPMLYANEYWLNNKIDMTKINYDVWVARYQVKHTFSSPAMWQATNTGQINGIKGNVDINFQYKDFSPVIPSNTWRTIGGNTYYYQNYEMKKNAWIDDGNGWYFMNETGNPSKNWLKQSDTYYYLDPNTGKMATDWKLLDNKWYYFEGSGKMATGWTQVGNSRYYLNQDGAMMTGWQDIDGKKYYLQSDGAAAAGWKQFDNTWYYFNNSNDMARGWVLVDGCWYYLNEEGKMATGWYSDKTGTYYLSTSSGKMTTGWRQVDGIWYYFNGSGQMQTGMITVDGQQYYLSPADGKMAVNTTVQVDGVDYQADASGICTKVEPAAEGSTGDGATTTAPPAETSNAAPPTESTEQRGPGV